MLLAAFAAVSMTVLAASAPVSIKAAEVKGLERALEGDNPTSDRYSGEVVKVICVVMDTGRLGACRAADPAQAFAAPIYTSFTRFGRVDKKYAGGEVSFAFRIP